MSQFHELRKRLSPFCRRRILRHVQPKCAVVSRPRVPKGDVRLLRLNQSGCGRPTRHDTKQVHVCGWMSSCARGVTRSMRTAPSTEALREPASSLRCAGAPPTSAARTAGSAAFGGRPRRGPGRRLERGGTCTLAPPVGAEVAFRAELHPTCPRQVSPELPNYFSPSGMPRGSDPKALAFEPKIATNLHGISGLLTAKCSDSHQRRCQPALMHLASPAARGLNVPPMDRERCRWGPTRGATERARLQPNSLPRRPRQSLCSNEAPPTSDPKASTSHVMWEAPHFHRMLVNDLTTYLQPFLLTCVCNAPSRVSLDRI